MSDVFDFLAKGGWLMIPIAACSVVALGFFLERVWSLQRAKVLPARFLDIVSELLEASRFQEAEAMCRGNDSHIAAVLEQGIRYHGRDRAVVKDVMQEAGQREVHFMERFVGTLSAVATIAPLLGLLGTVTGMISVFQRVVNQASAGHAADAGALANGIWEALITTAAGLTVAIPAYLAYRYVNGLIDRYAVEMVDVSLRAAEYLVPEEQSPVTRADTASAAPSPEQLAPSSEQDESEEEPADEPSEEHDAEDEVLEGAS